MKNVWLKCLMILLVASMLLSIVACNDSENAESDTDPKGISIEETTVTVEDSGTEEPTTETDADTPSESEEKTEVTEKTETVEKTEITEKTETVEKTETTEKIETTQEETTQEAETLEPIHGYDFEDDSWSSLFDMAGSATRQITDDPAGSGKKVLSVVHDPSQSVSWIRNKTSFTMGEHTKFAVQVDLYIPSGTLSAAGDYVQMQINGEYNHHVNLVSDAKESLTPFDTKDFPRDKWFTVRFNFDMSKLRYDLEIVEDGEVRTIVFAGRSASSLAGQGPLNLRVFVSGAGQTIYIDHHGLETGRKGDEASMKAVSFIRIDGVNAVGETLSVYGDFSGGATVNDLTDLKWERSDSYNGAYTAIAGAASGDYKPKDGGYYLRVSAKFGPRTLTSYPIYVREAAECGFFNGYLSHDGDTLTAAVVYNNEMPAFEASIKVTVYNGDTVVKTYTESFTAKQGSDVVIATFEGVDLTGKRAEMTVVAGNESLGEAVTVANDLPVTVVQKTSAGTAVLMEKQKIANFQKNRYMQFRSSIENDHWIGTEHNPIDMGFAYQETGVVGLANTEVQFTAAPGVFKIVFLGEKAGVKATQQNELIGFWDAEKEEFTYIYNCSMTADTESWHSKSSWASQGRIEAFDYHLERMSILDRVYNSNQNGDLYDYVIYENGNELVRIPKLPVPRTAIKGTYFYGFFLSPGESVFYPDAKEGGWKSTVLSDSGDTYVEICWSWYDIHSCSENSVPRVGNCNSFTVSQSWLFETTAAEHDAALIDKAIEVEWQDLPNYQLPLFSTDNTFETQFGGTDWQYAWWKSTYDCTMDAAVGHNGAGSVKIENKTSKEASWYTEGVWGYPYSFDQVQGKTYRVSGYIKAENVVGEAYIANIQYQHATPNDNTVTKSKSISGTTDWVYVSFTFVAQERKTSNGSTQRCIDHFFLTLNGTGTVWFDDVKIEEVK